MIERATACLNAGVRQPAESLRCVQRVAVRSRRALHQSFWNHNAPIVDAALLNLASPIFTLNRNNDRSNVDHGARHQAHSSVTCSSSDGGVFLDFLYPPQALAYLQRPPSRACPIRKNDARDPRRPRRPPSELHGSARRYSSRSHGATYRSQEEELSAGNGSEYMSGMELLMQNAEIEEDEEKIVAKGKRKQQKLKKKMRKLKSSLDQPSTIEETAAYEDSAGNTYTRNPRAEKRDADTSRAAAKTLDLPSWWESELAKALLTPVDTEGPLQQLQERIARRPPMSRQVEYAPSRFVDPRQLQLVENVVALYRSALAQQEVDGGIESRLLIWLADNCLVSADLHFMTIWQKTRDETRPFEAFEAALTVFRRQEMLSAELHAQVLRKFPELSRPFSERTFSFALNKKQWELAALVWRDGVLRMSGNDAELLGTSLLASFKDVKNIREYQMLVTEFLRWARDHAEGIGSIEDLPSAQPPSTITTTADISGCSDGPSSSEEMLDHCDPESSSDRPKMDTQTLESPSMSGTMTAPETLRDAHLENDIALRSADSSQETSPPQMIDSTDERADRNDREIHPEPAPLPTDYRLTFAAAVCQSVLSDNLRNHLSGKRTWNRNEAAQFLTHVMEFLLQYIPDRSATLFARDFLSAILDDNIASQGDMSKTIISRTYMAYRQRPHVKERTRPPKFLLAELFRIAIGYETRLARPSESPLPMDALVYDYEKYYQKLNRDLLTSIISIYATHGNVERVEEYAKYFRTEYPRFYNWRLSLWSLVHVHACRGDVEKAKAAFERVRQLYRENDENVHLTAWNSLVYAYATVDDVEGALSILQLMQQEPDLTPGPYAFHMCANLLAKRGDVDSVRDLLEQYDQITGQKRNTALVNTLILATLNNDDIAAATKLLEQCVNDVKMHRVDGPLTKGFNLIMTAQASARNLPDTVRVYRYMKAEGIPLSEDSYAALMFALSAQRDSDSAFVILRSTMPKEGFTPTALHFNIVMMGYMHTFRHRHVLWARAVMQSMNVKENAFTRSICLTARSRLEKWTAKKLSREEPAPPLIDTDKFEVTKPQTGADEPLHLLQARLDAGDLTEPAETAAEQEKGENSTLLSFDLIRAGSRGSGKIQLDAFEAKEMELDILEEASYDTLEQLAALLPDSVEEGVPVTRTDLDAAGHISKAYFAKVLIIYGPRRCLEAVRDLFDAYDSRNADPPINVLAALMKALLQVRSYEEVEACWLFAKEQGDLLTRAISLPQVQRKSEIPGAAQPAKDDVRPNTEGLRRTQRSSALRHQLNGPAFTYMKMLFIQNRIPDVIKLVTELVTQDYALDNRTWNYLIQQLCDPKGTNPFTLLAFSLAERFLIPGFPGWKVPKGFPVNRNDARLGLEYIHARYLPVTALLPHYKTLVCLGQALLGLRHLELGGSLEQSGADGMQKYIGTIKQVREQAPRTLFVVQSMPRVDDKLQRRMRREE